MIAINSRYLILVISVCIITFQMRDRVFGQEKSTDPPTQEVQKPQERMQEKPTDPKTQDVRELQEQIIKLGSEIHRTGVDQLNFYLTAVLAIFTILGLVGLLDIRRIRRNFDEELSAVQELRKEVEDKVQAVKTTDDIVKILDLKNDANAWIKNGDYSKAIQLLDSALLIVPNNITVLRAKAKAYFKAESYSDALAIYRTILSIEPDDGIAIVNSTEILLLNGDIEGFDNFYNSHKSDIDRRRNGLLIKYFLTLKAFVSEDLNEVEQISRSTVESLPSQQQNHIDDWEFTDALNYIAKKEGERIKSIFLTFINILHGDMHPDALSSFFE